MDTAHARLDLTHHARGRIQERDVPDCVLQRIVTDAMSFVGRHLNHRRIRLRIVRTQDTYWIAPYANGTILTVYSKPASEIESWGWKYLLNPEESRGRLLRLPIHRTAMESITDELFQRWAVES